MCVSVCVGVFDVCVRVFVWGCVSVCVSDVCEGFCVCLMCV